jgi:O-antigen/teichoic acid export membrane protein
MEWLLTISVLGFIIGTVLSVLEEWPKQGLTDTSYHTLLWWLGSSIGICVAAGWHGYLALSCIAVCAALLAAYAIKMKLYDHRQYFKNLSRAAQGMRHRGHS